MWHGPSAGLSPQQPAGTEVPRTRHGRPASTFALTGTTEGQPQQTKTSTATPATHPSQSPTATILLGFFLVMGTLTVNCARQGATFEPTRRPEGNSGHRETIWPQTVAGCSGMEMLPCQGLLARQYEGGVAARFFLILRTFHSFGLAGFCGSSALHGAFARVANVFSPRNAKSS
jgi:hypothetical protein